MRRRHVPRGLMSVQGCRYLRPEGLGAPTSHRRRLGGSSSNPDGGRISVRWWPAANNAQGRWRGNQVCWGVNLLLRKRRCRGSSAYKYYESARRGEHLDNGCMRESTGARPESTSGEPETATQTSHVGDPQNPHGRAPYRDLHVCKRPTGVTASTSLAFVRGSHATLVSTPVGPSRRLR